ncbi:MAG: O-antigen/teichoic acid export membrane protein [Hyphomicrobiaceae bacterium]
MSGRGAGLSDSQSNTPITRGSVARGAWYGLWAQAVDKVLPVVLLLYLARTLAPEQFGVYSFLVAYLAFFQVVSDYSLDTVLVRAISQNPEKGSSILRAGLGLKLLMAVLSAGAAIAFIGPASGWRVPADLAAVAALSLPTALGGAYRAWFRAHLDIRAVMLVACSRAGLLATGVFAAVAAGMGLRTIFVAMAVANLVNFLAVTVVLRRSVDTRPTVDRAIWKLVLSGAWPLMLNALATTVSLRASHILLMSIEGPVEVGRLGAAARVTEAFQLLPEALMISVYPVMADAWSRGSESLLGTARRTARYLMAVVGYPVVLCSVAGGLVMETLFGPEFRSASDILAVLAFLALFGATGAVIVNLLVATHRESALYRVTLVFAAANVAACAWAIPRFGGVGAAMAMLATSAASQVALAVLPASRQWVAPTMLAGLRAAVAIPVAIAATHWCSSEVSAAVVATFAYAAGLVVFRIVDRQEIEFLRGMWTRARIDE